MTRDGIHSLAMTPSAFSQCFQTLNPGGPRHLVVHPERAPLPVLLRPTSPRPASREAERDGSSERRVLGQRLETAEGGVSLCHRDGRRVSQLMSCRVTRTSVRLLMDGFLAPLDPNPASQLRESDSCAGKRPT